MPDDILTNFLVRLCIDPEVAKDFAADKDEVLHRKEFGLDELTVVAIGQGFEDSLRFLIGTQQGGGKGRAKEANRLAKKAEALAKTTLSVATSAASLARSFDPPVLPKPPARHKGKKR